MTARFSIAVLALPLSLFAAGAMADQMGRIVAEYDGASKEWYTIAANTGGKTVGSATFKEGRMLSDFHMQGHPVPRFTSTDVLSLDVSFRKPFKLGSEPLVVEIIHLPEGMSKPYWTSEQAPRKAVVTFETLDASAGRATGSFEATLCFVAGMGSDPDTTNCRDIKGSFDTAILSD